jgi:hypothetical protein
MSDWDLGRPAAGHFDVPRPSRFDGATYPYPLPYPLAQALETEDAAPPLAGGQSPADGGYPCPGGLPGGRRNGAADTAPPPVTSARDQFRATGPQPTTPPESYYPWPPAPYPFRLREAASSEERTDSGGRGGGGRWLIPAGIVAGTATAGALAVLLTWGQPSSPGPGGLAAPPATATIAVRVSTRPSPSPSATAAAPAAAAAPLTLTQAQAALARYTTVNNSANAQRSDTLLATVEAGSSYAIDAGQYQAQQAVRAAPYPPFNPVQATYYIPGDESATGPRWFVVQVANAFQSSPSTVTSDEYLLFTQSAPGGGWQNTIEPYLLSGASAPQIEVGADGLATAVSPDAASVTVMPSRLPAVTATSLARTAAGIADPGNLADRADQRLWQREVPDGTITDTHTAAPAPDGQEFALLTTDGGALVFYTDAAELTITPPTGSVLHLTVPGLYSSGQALTRAAVSYLEQFAAYDPPAATGGTPRVVADYSGITGKN